MSKVLLCLRWSYRLFCLACLSALPVLATDTQTNTDKVRALIEYKSPFSDGTLTRRTGAGTRGICGSIPGLEKSFSLLPLVPEKTALSAKSQPSLYWAVSHPFAGKFILNITPQAQFAFDYPASILETALVMSVDAGIQSLDLRDYAVKLQENKTYRWTVSLICDPKNRSLDLQASGTVQYQPINAELAQALLKQASKEHPILYARYGFWYDAFQSLTEQIPSEPTLKPIRAALLSQVGLRNVNQWLQIIDNNITF